MLLNKARDRASASIGEMVSLGHHLLTQQVQTYMEQTVLPIVIDQLPDLHFRVQKCYALLLTACRPIATSSSSDHGFINIVLTLQNIASGYDDVLSFFKDTWSPIVVDSHSQGGTKLTGYDRHFVLILKLNTTQKRVEAKLPLPAWAKEDKLLSHMQGQVSLILRRTVVEVKPSVKD